MEEVSLEQLQQSLVDFSNRRNNVVKFKDYQDYINAQCVEGLSHEITSEHWSNGQIKCINDKFKDVPKDYNILIASCGDGVCLKHLSELGYTNVTGLEIADEKILNAKKFNMNVIKTDICTGPFNLTETYDVIYTSHTLEHVLCPEYTLTELTKFLKPDGIIHVILPYPDKDAANPTNPTSLHRFRVHCGVMPLGLHIDDGGETTCYMFKMMGFHILDYSFHSYRENEIHLVMKKSKNLI
jgi:SAM-dependent methyltransferase